jgi:hypothetical protein
MFPRLEMIKTLIKLRDHILEELNTIPESPHFHL